MRPTTPEYFWSKVDRGGDGCWEWRGLRLTSGYGQIRVGGKGVRAHRYAWQVSHGPISPGLVVCHKCDNRSCVHPDHLFLGTVQDNTDDRVAKGRQLRGSGIGVAKLTEHDIVDIRSLHAFGATTKALASAYGMCRQSIRNIILRQYWSHV